ncbi:MAG: hypothetical protein AABZ67_10760 [Pseudomonadota bacterium]
MNIRLLVSGCALGLCFASSAFALDVTPAVRVTPLVKTTSSWNGAPQLHITY